MPNDRTGYPKNLTSVLFTLVKSFGYSLKKSHRGKINGFNVSHCFPVWICWCLLAMFATTASHRCPQQKTRPFITLKAFPSLRHVYFCLFISASVICMHVSRCVTLVCRSTVQGCLGNQWKRFWRAGKAHINENEHLRSLFSRWVKRDSLLGSLPSLLWNSELYFSEK